MFQIIKNVSEKSINFSQHILFIYRQRIYAGIFFRIGSIVNRYFETFKKILIKSEINTSCVFFSFFSLCVAWQPKEEEKNLSPTHFTPQCPFDKTILPLTQT